MTPPRLPSPSRTVRPAAGVRRARGLGAVAIIVVLVGLSALAAAIVRLSVAASATVAQDVLATRATAAARAGLQWGLYQAFKGGWTACAAATQTLDLVADTGMRVTVSCDSRSWNEGESAPGVPRTLRTYTLEAVACNGASSCPDAGRAVQPGYVERKMLVHASD